MARYDENGKYSLANQLAVLVNPRWEALKDLGNAALKAGEPRVAVVWYERAASLTDANITAMAFFKALGGAAEHTAAARLASAERDLRDVILRFLPDGPRVGVPFDADGQARAAARGVPPEGTEPNLPRATCLANAAAALLKAGEPEVFSAAAAGRRLAGRASLASVSPASRPPSRRRSTPRSSARRT